VRSATTVCLGNLRPAGRVTYRVRPAGEAVVTLSLSDRGRGEALASHLHLDAAGIPLSERLTGVDYWKNPIDERFALAHGKAAWSSGQEKGEKTVARPAFYVTGAGSLLEIGLLAAALLENRDHRLPLLPDGEAWIERAGAARVAVGKESRSLTLYALSGLAVSPLYVWMDPSGTFFGRYDGFVTVVRQGWEAAAPALIKEQTAVIAAHARGDAARLGRRPPGGLAVRGARLFDPATGTVTDGVTVVVAGNRIRAVGRDGEVAVPAGAEVVEAHGRMLLPGLWDMHQHLSDGDGLLDLAAGVTTGRDLGNDADYLLDLKHKWDTGEALGPRVVLAGVIDGPGPFASPTKVLVDSEAKARAAVDQYAALGYVQIKIYSSVDPKLVPAIVAEAHRLGLRVSGHIPNGMTAADAVRAGFDEIQHTNFLFLNFIPGVDTRTPERMTAVAEHAAEIDLASPAVKDFLRLLQERKTVIDPTVTIYEDLLTGRPDRVRPSLAAVEPRLPYQMRRTLLGGNLPVPPGKEQRYLDSYPRPARHGAPPPRRRDPAGGGDRLDRGRHAPPRARELRPLGNPGPGGPAHRHPRRRPRDEARRRPGHDRPGQARRPDPGRRRPDAEHQRHPARRPHRQGRRGLRPRGALPHARRQTGGVRRARAGGS